MGWLTGIWAKLAIVCGAILAMLLAVLRIFVKGEQAGAAKVEAKAAQETAKDVGKANDVQTQVAAKPEGAAARELEDKWTR